MNDILFDIITREIVLTDSLFTTDLDFKTTDNPSVQNGGICLFGRCINLSYPMFGIGMEEPMGANMNKMAYELNRWQTQVKNDGATVATWKAVYIQPNKADFETDISYL